MAEANKQQIGDGSDSYGAAAQTAAKAAKSAASVGKDAGKAAAQTAASKGAEATANAAAATVKAGVEGGKAVSEIAAYCLRRSVGSHYRGGMGNETYSFQDSRLHLPVRRILIVIIVELPSIIINRVLGIDGNPPTEQTTITSVYDDTSDAISDIIEAAYDSSMEKVKSLINNGGYDYELSMNALINHAQSSAGYDVAYIMAAYSTSVEQLNTSQSDMEAKLTNVSGDMFPVTSVEKQNEVITPVTYYTYKPIKITVVTKVVRTGTINGVAQYRYETAEKTYYIQDEQKYSDVEVTVNTYSAVTVTIRIVVMTITLIPLAVVAMMGIDGDSLFQYLGHIIRYFINRRKLTFRRVGYKYDPNMLRKKKKSKKKTGKA